MSGNTNSASSRPYTSRQRQKENNGYTTRVFQRGGGGGGRQPSAAASLARNKVADEESPRPTTATNEDVRPYDERLVDLQEYVLQRRKMGLPLAVSPEDFPAKENSDRSTRFIRQNFKMKTRDRPRLSRIDEGEVDDSHDQDDEDEEGDVRESQTDAFGLISLKGYSSEPRRYVRLSDDTDPALVYKLLRKEWGVITETPSLVLNIVGGSAEKLFGQNASELGGILKSPNALYLSNGLDSSELSLEAPVEDPSGVCVGICPWGLVRGREGLVNLDFDVTRNYNSLMLPQQRSSHSFVLSPQHSCYLMADNGHEGSLTARRGADKMQAKLCQFFHGEGVRVVTVLMDTSMEKWPQIERSCRFSDVVVLTAASTEENGEAWDILQAVLKKAGDGRDVSADAESRIKEAIGNMLKSSNSGKGTSSAGRRFYFDALMDASEQHRKIIAQQSKPESDGGDARDDFSLSLGQAIVKRLIDGTDDPVAQLNLAVEFQQPQMANEILAKGEIVQVDVYKTILQLLLDQKVEFLASLVDDGQVSLSDFLTRKTLNELYKRTDLLSSLDDLMLHFVFGCDGLSIEEEDVLDMVYILLVSLLPDYTWEDIDRAKIAAATKKQAFEKDYLEVVKPTKEDKFKEPYFELFIWAILCDKTELLPLFHKLSKHPLILAEVGAILSDKLAVFRSKQGEVGANKSAALHENYVLKTNKMIDLAMNLNPKKTRAVLQVPLERFGGRHLLDLAFYSNLVDVVANDQCFALMDINWKRGFNKINVFRTLLCLLSCCVCLFVTPLIEFRKEYLDGDINLFRRFHIFFMAPVVKFTLNFISVVVYVLMFSYATLFSFRWKYTWPEVTVYIWVLCYVIAELAEILSVPTAKLAGQSAAARSMGCLHAVERAWRLFFAKFREYRRDTYNRMDIVVISLMAATLVLRQFEETFFLARILFASASAFIWTRIFRFYHTSLTLGPKLKAVGDMLMELMAAVLLIAVFVCAYGVGVLALTDPYRTTTGRTVVDTFSGALSLAFFQIFGELQLDKIEPNTNIPVCTADQDSTFDYCQPDDGQLERFEAYKAATNIFLAVYLVFTAILLLNMFIAIFTSIYERNEENSLRVWKWERYRLLGQWAAAGGG